jgi:hypothetical protein
MEVGEGIINLEKHQTLKALKEVRTLEPSLNLQKTAEFVAKLVGIYVKAYSQPLGEQLLIESRW